MCWNESIRMALVLYVLLPYEWIRSNSCWADLAVLPYTARDIFFRELNTRYIFYLCLNYNFVSWEFTEESTTWLKFGILEILRF